VILNSVVSFTLSPQEMYANEVSFPIYYIFIFDAHYTHMDAVPSYLFDKKIIRDSEESVTFN
jgi:hypothetical protein